VGGDVTGAGVVGSDLAVTGVVGVDGITGRSGAGLSCKVPQALLPAFTLPVIGVLAPAFRVEADWGVEGVA